MPCWLVPQDIFYNLKKLPDEEKRTPRYLYSLTVSNNWLLIWKLYLEILVIRKTMTLVLE